jgi:hypothetical protein
MGRPRSNITLAADQAIHLTHKAGQPLSPANCWAMAVKHSLPSRMLTRYDENQAIDKIVHDRIVGRLKETGHIIGDRNTHERVPYGHSTVLERIEQQLIRAEHLDWVRRHEKCHKQAERLLTAKSKKVGRPVEPWEYRAEIDAIFEAEGLASPF